MQRLRHVPRAFLAFPSLGACSSEDSDPDDVPDSVVVGNLRDAGPDLCKPHAIDFNLYAADESETTKLETQRRAQGFDVAIDQGDFALTPTERADGFAETESDARNRLRATAENDSTMPK